jgi:tripartite-type tricarboxylate transporter receptor subunit TctC
VKRISESQCADRSGVRLVLGFSPGSASDVIARIIAPAWSEELGCPVGIELRPGDNGADAAAAVAAAAPDGRTLFMATLGTQAIGPQLSAGARYDPLRDFAPVALVATSPLLLGCHPSLPFTCVQELIAYASAHPGTLAYGTSAIGGAPHLAAELFQSMTGVHMRHVRYEQTRRLYDDLESGGIALSFNNMMSMLPRCRAGSLRALAVTAAARITPAPDIPTLAESGLPRYEMANWVGIVAPAGTPAPLVARLCQTIAAALRRPAVSSSLTAAGVTPASSDPEAFAKWIALEIERWRPVIARFRHNHA